VWEALRLLAWGETVSYAELARRAGVPGAARAIGAANGRNPIPVVVPCHRVIGADGTLTGFGGGVERKEWLLAHEGAWPAARRVAAPSLWDGADAGRAPTSA
jgi:methylated-DNA-[protein]-cysteine S-methyltransferase